MKIKSLYLMTLILAFAAIGFAQPKTKAKTTTTATTADAVVRNLYAAEKAGKSPFFQTKSRALIDQYFAKDLADMIWKDSLSAKGDLGAIDFDPLYNSQDPQVTNLVIGKPRQEGGENNAFVAVTFESYGKNYKVDYELMREATGKPWKITGIFYDDGEDLGSLLRYWQDEEFKKEYESLPFKGEYMVGSQKCTVTPTLNSISYRVDCEGQEGFKLYAVEGSETETAYIYMDEKGTEKSRFVFKTGEASGKFIAAGGKEVAVSQVK